MTIGRFLVAVPVLALATFGAFRTMSAAEAAPAPASATESRTKFVALLTSVQKESDPGEVKVSGTLKAFSRPPATPARPRR